jgi:membrane-bound lytic murein transglycosylase B
MPPLRLAIVFSSIILLFSTTAGAEQPTTYEAEMDAFIGEMVEKHGFDPVFLQTLLKQAVYQQKIIDAISRPAEAMPWHKYRPIFVTRARAMEGVLFWDVNRALLERAEAEYGVPPEIIVAIIGVETRYGRHAGSYPVIDALTTLGFGYPKRSAFFRRQLEEFLLLIREEQIDPTQAKGSYAGAMGQPQFIPSSYRSYAVDFDGDGSRDLWRSNADVIGSVAAYFQRHGWVAGAPITSRAQGVEARHRDFVEAGMKPSIPFSRLQAEGITGEFPLEAETLGSLIQLEGKQEDEYWLGLNNFYVITRYNHSNLYAMAVYQLSREILAMKEAVNDPG